MSIIFDIETVDIEQRIRDAMGKKFRLGAQYRMGGMEQLLRGAYGNSKRWDDMKCIGGTVTVIGNKFAASRKLFMKPGAATGLLYVKTARMRFCPLCVDGTLSNGRKWSELELPKTHAVKAYDVKDGGHVEAHDIVLAARNRIMGVG
jgi:hypothetical protein